MDSELKVSCHGKGQVTPWSEAGVDHLSQDQAKEMSEPQWTLQPWTAREKLSQQTVTTIPAKSTTNRSQASLSTADASNGCQQNAQSWITSVTAGCLPDQSCHTWNGEELEG